MTIYSDTIHWWDIIPIFCPLLIRTLLPNLTFYLIVWGFHRTFATGAACQQRKLAPPDTWSCTTLGLACVLMSRPISPELVSGLMSFEHPSVLLFCFYWINPSENCAWLGERKGGGSTSPVLGTHVPMESRLPFPFIYWTKLKKKQTHSNIDLSEKLKSLIKK